MKKLYHVTKDEWYPVWSIGDEVEQISLYECAVLTEDELSRIRKAFQEFDEVQTLILEKLKDR